MKTPAEVLLKVAAIGGQLGIADDKLRMLLPADCSVEVKTAIRLHKAALLRLIKSNFLLVQSDALNAMLFWTPDSTTKEDLVAAGADRGQVYTATELQALIKSAVASEDLASIHAAKTLFSGQIFAA